MLLCMSGADHRHACVVAGVMMGTALCAGGGEHGAGVLHMSQLLHTAACGHFADGALCVGVSDDA